MCGVERRWPACSGLGSFTAAYELSDSRACGSDFEIMLAGVAPRHLTVRVGGRLIVPIYYLYWVTVSTAFGIIS